MSSIYLLKRSKPLHILLSICVTGFIVIFAKHCINVYALDPPYEDISKFKKYDFGFFFPLEINLRKLVDAKIVNNTELAYSPIHRHPFKYLHRPPACVFSSDKSKLIDPHQTLNTRLLVLVKSAVGNNAMRTTIRMTWAKEAIRLKARVVFLLAAAENSINHYVDLEADTFKDIVQEDFVDHYSNNTYKTIMGYNWAVKYCSTADLFLFVDDDHFVNMPKVLNYSQNIPPSQRENFIVGWRVIGGTPSRGDSKWVMSKDEFPYHNFPPYIGGGAYLTSYTCARQFVISFPYVDFFWIDDVYLGIVAQKLNIELQHSKEFQTHEHDLSLDRGFFSHHNDHSVHGMAKAWYRYLSTS